MVNPAAATPEASAPPAGRWIGLAAAAGALGWGIRGQYGHETGAMFAGGLVSLVLVMLAGRGAPPGPALRAAAWGTVAMGIGGSMTYGQTIGLTQSAGLVGRWDALAWGLLGLGLKGAIWVAFAGLLLGMGLGGVRYTWRQIAGLLAGMGLLYWLGIRILNSPFEPAQRVLPAVYFSASWSWQPEAGPELKPRPEVWGGLLFALAGAWVWAGWRRGDVLARRLAAWGALGGLGFPLGQLPAAWHAWHRDWFVAGAAAEIAARINWWNWMETIFGAVLGAALGAGLWRNRALIRWRETEAADRLAVPVAWSLLGLHVVLLVLSHFTAVAWANALYDPGLVLAAIPLLAVAGDRIWPAALVLPVTLLPLAGKTLRRMVGEGSQLAPTVGWSVYLALPMAVAVAGAVWARRAPTAETAAARALPVLAALGFGLNFAFFQFPWPWLPWTARTPNALAFALCLAALAAAAWPRRRAA